MKMERFIKFLCTLAVLLATGGTCNITAQTQIPMPHNWDEDIYTLRHLAAPQFNFAADDYVQYAPAALMVGLKACGYEGRSDWASLAVADAFSVAVMTALVRSVKPIVDRTRPNGGNHSFPSGHTATAFMTATMLHMEYGWRSPWWSIAGYTMAAYTGVSRILNNRHWMSDVAAGAVIGVGSVHLGYYLSELIFKGKRVNPAYEAPVFGYDPSEKHYVAEFLFGRRFILDESGITRGGVAALSTDIPLIPGAGITAKASASSLTYVSGQSNPHYGAMAGGYYNYHFASRLEVQAKAMAGCGWYMGHCGADIAAGVGLSFFLNDNFKIKAFAEYETMDLGTQMPWLQSLVLGWSSAWTF
jgi:membrane-associated phospholipid phosphatase